MGEAADKLYEVWSKLHGDPDLIEGLLYGEWIDIDEGLAELIGEKPEIFCRQIPFLVFLRFTKPDQTNEERLANLQEYLRVPAIQHYLNERAGL